jgi:RNA polymerase sigma factor (sigma-70 family)
MSTYGLQRSPAPRPTDAGRPLPVTSQPGVESSRQGRHGRERPADRVLVGRVRRGDAQAFETIFRRYQTPLLSYCRHMLGNRDEAEDALQQAFIRAHRGLVSSAPPRELRPWLYTIARNCCHSAIAARRPVDDLADHEPSIAGLAEAVRDRADLRDLVRDVQALPEDQRSALLLAELGDLSHEEIARIVECPPRKVKALIHQARTALIAQRAARATPCAEIRAELSVARGGQLRRGPLRRHLSLCAGCREYAVAVSAQRDSLAVALPVLPTAGFALRVLGHTATGAAAAGSGAAAAGVSGTAAAGSATAAAGSGTAAAGSATAAAGSATAAAGSGAAAAGVSGTAAAGSGTAAAAGSGTAAAAGSGTAAAAGSGAAAAGVSGAGTAGTVLGGGLAAKLAIGGAVAVLASAGAAVTLRRPPSAPLRPSAAVSARVSHAGHDGTGLPDGSKPTVEVSSAVVRRLHPRRTSASRGAVTRATKAARARRIHANGVKTPRAHAPLDKAVGAPTARARAHRVHADAVKTPRAHAPLDKAVGVPAARVTRAGVQRARELIAKGNSRGRRTADQDTALPSRGNAGRQRTSSSSGRSRRQTTALTRTAPPRLASSVVDTKLTNRSNHPKET